jgi:hypothetical protein
LVEISGFFTDINLNQPELWHSGRFEGFYLVYFEKGRIKKGDTRRARTWMIPDRNADYQSRLFAFGQL